MAENTESVPENFDASAVFIIVRFVFLFLIAFDGRFF